MNRTSFSMVELAFVIVILGVLVSFALPTLLTNRDDARAVALRSDINSAINSIPAKIFENNIDVSNIPSGFNNWGEWIIYTTGLDKSKWRVAVNNDGISPVVNSSLLSCSSNGILRITNNSLVFNPEEIKLTNNLEKFCRILRDSYPSNYKRVIPLIFTAVNY